MEVPKLINNDMYKFLMYTLLQKNFTVLSTETISELGATITTQRTVLQRSYSRCSKIKHILP